MKYVLFFLVILISIYPKKKEPKIKNCDSLLEKYQPVRNLTKKPFVKINFKLSDYYPNEAKKKNIRKGESSLRVFIDKKGNLACYTIIKKSEQKEFDEAAIKIIKKAKYKAGEINSSPVDSYVVFPIHFSLDE